MATDHDVKSRINDQDMEHLQSFPPERKVAVLDRIMSRKPAESLVLNGDSDFEKTLLKLRREGYQLIDLQREDIAFTTVWYRNGKALFGRAGADVAMLLWEIQEPGGSTSVYTWRF